MRGSSSPRKNSSSPSAVLKTNWTTRIANQTQLPDIHVCPASEPKKAAASRVDRRGEGGQHLLEGRAARISGRTIHQSFLLGFPVRGADRAC